MGDAGFDPGTSAPEVWCATAEPSHFFLIETQLAVILNFKMIIRLCGVNDVNVFWLLLKKYSDNKNGFSRATIGARTSDPSELHIISLSILRELFPYNGGRNILTIYHVFCKYVLY